MGKTPGSGCPEDHLCFECYRRYLILFGIIRATCPVCEEDVSGDKTYNIHPEHRPFLPPEKRGAEFFCRSCYDRTKDKMSEAAAPSTGAIDEQAKTNHFPAHSIGLGAASCSVVGRVPAPIVGEVSSSAGAQGDGGEKGCTVEESNSSPTLMGGSREECWPPEVGADGPTGAKRVDLAGMFQSMVNHRFTGDALADIAAYERHVDLVTGGLFAAFLAALPNNTPETKTKLAMLLELFGHLVDPTYSHTAWELTWFLHSSGVSNRDLRALSAKGLAMCSSKLVEHEKRMAEAHARRVDEMAHDPEQRVVLVTDDFHQIEGAKGTPRKSNSKKNGRFSVAHHVSNAILKGMAKKGLDIPVAQYPECLTPAVLPVDSVLRWVEEHWVQCSSSPYLGTRLKYLEKISATLQPYGTLEAGSAWNNPITMENVTLLRCFENAFKDPKDIEKEFSDIGVALESLLERQHVPATGDFYSFINLYRLVVTKPIQFGHFLPIPGAFHIGLNAQEGVFFYYRPVVERVWDAVFPKKRLDPEPTPLERKFALEVLCEGWKKCRTFCLELLENIDKISFEAILLVQFFEEHLPISLDIYAVFLSGDMLRYEQCLLRVLRMFIQLGKCNYVLCISIFIAQLMHWKVHYPALYEHLCEKLRYFSEEEVEILHSMIRPHVRGRKTAKQIVREINAWGSSMKMLRMWRHPNGRKASARKKATQLTPDVVGDACRAIKVLFKSVIIADSYCTREPNSKKWKSPVLGEFSDHLLPYSLQQATVRVRGCSAIGHEDREEADGFVDPSCSKLCGHRRDSGTFCQACLTSTMQVVREMLTQQTVCGAHFV